MRNKRLSVMNNWKRVSRQNYDAYIEVNDFNESLKSRSEINKAASRQLFIQTTKVVLSDLNVTAFGDDIIYSKIENRLKELEGVDDNIAPDTDVEETDHEIAVKTRNANTNHETDIEIISISSSISDLSHIGDELNENNEKPEDVVRSLKEENLFKSYKTEKSFSAVSINEEKGFEGFTNNIDDNEYLSQIKSLVPETDQNRHCEKVSSSLNAKNTQIRPEEIEYDEITDFKDIKSNETESNCLALSRQKRKRTAVTYNETHMERYFFYDSTYNARKQSNIAGKRKSRSTIPKQNRITNTANVACQTIETGDREKNLDVAIWKKPTKNKSDISQEKNNNFVAATIVHVENKPNSNEKSEVEINIPRTLRNTMNESCLKISIDLSKIDLPHKVLQSLDAAKKHEPKTKRKLKAITNETEVNKPKKKRNRTKKTQHTEKSAIAQYVEHFSNDCEPSTDNAVTSCFSPEGSNNLISTTSNNNMNGNIYMNENGQWVLTTETQSVPQNNNNVNNAGNYNPSQEPYDCIQLDDDIVIPLDIEDNALQLVNYIENDEQTGNLISPFDTAISSNDNITQPEFQEDKDGFNHVPRATPIPKRLSCGNFNFDNAPSKILGDLRPAHSSSYNITRPLCNDAIDLTVRNIRQYTEFKPQKKCYGILDLSLKSPSNLSSQPLQTSIQTSISRNTYSEQDSSSDKYESKIEYSENPPKKLLKKRRRITMEEYTVRQKNNGTTKIEVLNVEQIYPIKKMEIIKGNDMPSLNFDEELNYEENMNETEDGVISERLALENSQTEISTGTDIKEVIAENVKSTVKKDTKDSPRENINSISSTETSSYFDYNVFSVNGICTPTGKNNESEFNTFEGMECEYNDRDDDIISLHPDGQSLLGSPWYNNDDPPDKELNTPNKLENFADDLMPSSTSHTKPLCSVKRNATTTITFNVDQREINVGNSFTSTSTEPTLSLASKPNETSIKNYKIPKKAEKSTEFINIQRKITNENFISTEERPREEMMPHQVLQPIVQSSSPPVSPAQFRNVGQEVAIRSEILSLFGYPCLQYLSGMCQRNNCHYSHQLLNPSVINTKIWNMPYHKLCQAYVFIRRYHKTFVEYFPIFCEIFAKSQFRNKIIQMINDCELFDDCFQYLRIVLNCLMKTGVNNIEALRMILARYQNKSFDMITLLVDMILEIDVLVFLKTLEEFSNIPHYQFKMDAANHMAAICNQTKNVDLTQVVLKILLAIPKEEIEVNKSQEVVKLLISVSKLSLQNTNSLSPIGDNNKLGSVTTLELQADNDTLINHNNQIQYMNLSSTRNF